MAEGVDLFGLYNTVTDWRAVRDSGIEFAWIKLSDGDTNRDDYGYVAAGRGVGIAMGGYHYAQPGDPVAQANRLVDRCIATGALELAPALDLESPFVPGPAAVNFAVGFLRQLAARGHVPVFYANNNMLSGVLNAVRAAVPDVKVWGAAYGSNLTVPHDVHQYTSTGSVPGIVGNVDRNTGSILRNTGTAAPTVSATTPTTTQKGAEIMDPIHVPASDSPTAVRVESLTGSPTTGLIIRPKLNRDGLANSPVFVSNVYAWGSDKSGVGGNPAAQPGYNPRLVSAHWIPLPGALWADVEYACHDGFDIQPVG